MSPSSSAPLSMRRSARETVAAVPIQRGVPGAVSGRQRRQGRNPAASAAAAQEKKSRFLRNGGRAGQMGRQ